MVLDKDDRGCKSNENGCSKIRTAIFLYLFICLMIIYDKLNFI